MPQVELQRQVSLAGYPQAIAVPYPDDWDGFKSGDEDERHFSLSPQPTILSADEIEYGREYIATVMKLPNAQIVETGAIMGPPDDPLYQWDHDKLNQLEQELGFPNSEFIKSGGQNSVNARVIIIRERGYDQDGSEIEIQEASLEEPPVQEEKKPGLRQLPAAKTSEPETANS